MFYRLNYTCFLKHLPMQAASSPIFYCAAAAGLETTERGHTWQGDNPGGTSPLPLGYILLHPTMAPPRREMPRGPIGSNSPFTGEHTEAQGSRSLDTQPQSVLHVTKTSALTARGPCSAGVVPGGWDGGRRGFRSQNPGQGSPGPLPAALLRVWGVQGKDPTGPIWRTPPQNKGGDSGNFDVSPGRTPQSWSLLLHRENPILIGWLQGERGTGIVKWLFKNESAFPLARGPGKGIRV